MIRPLRAMTAMVFACHCVAGHAVERGGARSSGVVILIQDIHADEGAQRDIARAVEKACRTVDIGLIGLEGASGPIELERFRAFPHRPAVRLVADFLLRDRRISGPVYAAMTSAVPMPPVLGLEEPGLYQENIAAYRRSVGSRAMVERTLERERRRLDRVKNAVYGGELRRIDSLVSRLNDSEDLQAQIEMLSAHALIPAGSALAALAECGRLEARIDFQAAQRERGRLLSRLAGRLGEAEASALLADARAFEAGSRTAYRFFTRLFDVAERHGIRISDYPQLSAYAQYLQKAGAIDPGRIIRERERLIDQIIGLAAKSPSERRVVRESAALELRRKLARFSLSRDEWRRYLSLNPAAPGLDANEDFYECATRRDRAMAERLIAGMRRAKTRNAIAVAGGFHSEGLAARLREAGFSVVVYTPTAALKTAGGPSDYLRVFSGETTAIDRWMRAESAALADHPAQLGLAPELVALAMELGDPSQRLDDAGGIVRRLGGRARGRVATADGTDGATLTAPWGRISADHGLRRVELARPNAVLFDVAEAAGADPATMLSAGFISLTVEAMLLTTAPWLLRAWIPPLATSATLIIAFSLIHALIQLFLEPNREHLQSFAAAGRFILWRMGFHAAVFSPYALVGFFMPLTGSWPDPLSAITGLGAVITHLWWDAKTMAGYLRQKSHAGPGPSEADEDGVPDVPDDQADLLEWIRFARPENLRVVRSLDVLERVIEAAEAEGRVAALLSDPEALAKGSAGLVAVIRRDWHESDYAGASESGGLRQALADLVFRQRRVGRVISTGEAKRWQSYVRIPADPDTVIYALYGTRSRQPRIFFGSVPPEEVRKAAFMVVQNIGRARRPGGATGKRLDPSDPATRILLFSRIVNEFPDEIYLLLRGVHFEWVTAVNPFPIWPGYTHLTLSRKDENVSQATMSSPETVEDLLLMLDRINPQAGTVHRTELAGAVSAMIRRFTDKGFSFNILMSPAAWRPGSVWMAVNGWYYSDADDAPHGGASQSLAHAQAGDVSLPVLTAPLRFLRKIGNVNVFSIDRGYQLHLGGTTFLLTHWALVGTVGRLLALISEWFGGGFVTAIQPGLVFQAGHARVFVAGRRNTTGLPYLSNPSGYIETFGSPNVNPFDFFELTDEGRARLLAAPDLAAEILKMRKERRLSDVREDLLDRVIASLQVLNLPQATLEEELDSLNLAPDVPWYKPFAGLESLWLLGPVVVAGFLLLAPFSPVLALAMSGAAASVALVLAHPVVDAWRGKTGEIRRDYAGMWRRAAAYHVIGLAGVLLAFATGLTAGALPTWVWVASYLLPHVTAHSLQSRSSVLVTEPKPFGADDPAADRRTLGLLADIFGLDPDGELARPGAVRPAFEPAPVRTIRSAA